MLSSKTMNSTTTKSVKIHEKIVVFHKIFFKLNLKVFEQIVLKILSKLQKNNLKIKNY